MSKNEEIQELVKKMTLLLPLTIEDAARIIIAVYSGHEMPDILSKIKEMKANIEKEILRRKARYQKGAEDGMDGIGREIGTQDQDYLEGYSFGAHVRTRDDK